MFAMRRKSSVTICAGRLDSGPTASGRLRNPARLKVQKSESANPKRQVGTLAFSHKSLSIAQCLTICNEARVPECNVYTPPLARLGPRDIARSFGRIRLDGLDLKARVRVLDGLLGGFLVELAGHLELGLFGGNVDLNRIFLYTR